MLRDKAERKAFQRVINNPGTSFRVSNMCNLCQSVRLTLRKQPSQMKKYISIFQAIFLTERINRSGLWIFSNQNKQPFCTPAGEGLRVSTDALTHCLYKFIVYCVTSLRQL